CLLRDAETGAKVNLTDLGRVADVYVDIIHKVQLLLENDSSESAAWWRARLKDLEPRQVRKLLKTAAGTFAYGATPAGMAEQIAEVYEKLFGEGRVPTGAKRRIFRRLIIHAPRAGLPPRAATMDLGRDCAPC